MSAWTRVPSTTTRRTTRCGVGKCAVSASWRAGDAAHLLSGSGCLLVSYRPLAACQSIVNRRARRKRVLGTLIRSANAHSHRDAIPVERGPPRWRRKKNRHRDLGGQGRHRGLIHKNGSVEHGSRPVRQRAPVAEAHRMIISVSIVSHVDRARGPRLILSNGP